MSTGSNRGSIRRNGRKRIRRLKLDLLRLRIAYRVLPERFRGISAGYWKQQIESETAQIEASVLEITELTEELRGGSGL